MNAEGYRSDPLSTKMIEFIEARLVYLRTELRMARGRCVPHFTDEGKSEQLVKIARLEGNIGSLEWVLREAETIRQNPAL